MSSIGLCGLSPIYKEAICFIIKMSGSLACIIIHLQFDGNLVHYLDGNKELS